MAKVTEFKELRLRRLEKLVTDFETKTGHRAKDILEMERLCEELWKDIPPDLKARARKSITLWDEAVRDAKERGVQ